MDALSCNNAPFLALHTLKIFKLTINCNTENAVVGSRASKLPPETEAVGKRMSSNYTLFPNTHTLCFRGKLQGKGVVV